MYNRRYDKIFLMLRQETAGYSIGSRAPWGSCILELKNGRGRLQLTVQGLRPLRQAYRVYLLTDAARIFCGTLAPDAKAGHAVLQWDFAPDAIGTGERVEDIHTVLILAEYGENGVSAPLLAYIAEEKDWRALLALPAAPAVQPIEQPAEAVKAAKVQESISLQAAEAAAPIAPVRGKEQPTGYHGSFRGLLAKFRQELEELEADGVLSAQEVARIRQSGAQKDAELPAEDAEACIAEAPEDTAESLEELQEPLENAVKSPAEEVSPFAKNRTLEPFGDGESWKCIALAELTLLAQIPLQWQKALFFLLPQRRYHHLILREDAAGVWLGLPAVYSEQDAADAKQFGFDAFRRVDGDWGYWLTHLEKD